MLALAATNAMGAVLFAVVYAAAGARLMSQGAFIACLLVIFTLVTTLWVRIEARHRPLGLVRRLGRIAAGFVMTALVVPTLVLGPAFWVDTQLPPDAGFTPFLAPLMTLVLIALALTALVTVVGSIIAAGRGTLGSGARMP